jgi:hypothetical protein
MGKLFIFPDELRLEVIRRAALVSIQSFTAATEMCEAGNTPRRRSRQHQPEKSTQPILPRPGYFSTSM